MAMVDRLVSWQIVRKPAVDAAMRAVPRHQFVPEVAADQAYANRAIVTMRDAEGVAVSSASAPGVVAGMLEQLDVRPGHRILEIGAGTGYNAALLAHLAGPDGQVTAIDIEPAVAAGATRNLAATGHESVTVACADGELGWPPAAPYDRIIVTAGAWDIPPAWHAQLAPGGRLVVPLRMRGLTRGVAFEWVSGRWRSLSIEELGFVPMRGAGAVAERNLRIGRHEDITLRVDDGQAADARALSTAIDGPAYVSWSGVSVPAGVLGHLDFWLAPVASVARLLLHSGGPVSGGLPVPLYDWGSMALYDDGTLSYLTRRAVDLGSGAADWELGVCGFGPRRLILADQVTARIRKWGRDREVLGELSIEAYPANAPADRACLLSIDKIHTRICVRAPLPVSS